MEYHQHQPLAPHLNQFNQQSGGSGGLSLPDASSSSEKALMWSNTGYISESGYSTQAPSISGIDAFLNNEQMDSTMQQMDNASTISGVTSITQTQSQQQQQPSQAQYAQLQSVAPPTQPQVQQDLMAPTDSDNAVANWMNSQDNSEMAIKAIPDLLKLLLDEDLVVVQQAAILLNQMSRMEAPRMGLIQTNNSVECLVNCLNTTADLETARSLVGALYGVSAQKPMGVQAIINSKALQPLVKMLSAPTETIISYAITTLHNVLLDCGDKVKMQMRKMGAVHQMIPLLSLNQNVKFLSIVVDCLQLLAFGNQEAKQIILEMGGTQLLVGILVNHSSYQKLLLNTTRLLKVLSVCSQNKQALIQLNAMQALALHLNKTADPNVSSSSGNPNTQHDILQNCLITLRNLSDAATRLNGLEQLVQNLVQLLAQTQDYTVSTLAAGILSNLTCNNENNKKAAMRSNAVQILLKIIQQNMFNQKQQLVEPCLCALRHITNRHSDMLLCQEQIRNLNGVTTITQLMSIKPRQWQCQKAALGLVRNLCSNQLNAMHLRQNCIIEKLMQVLYDAYTEVQMRTNQSMNPNLVVKIEDVNLLDIVDASAASLLILAKDYQNQILMRDLDCIGFFVQMFFSPIMNNQKAASSILAELASSKECADVIEQQAGLHQFVQANFCNQFGMLKTIAELTGTNSNSNAAIILQHVTTLMQRLQDHKNRNQQQQQFMPQQQQQQQQRPPQFPPNNVAPFPQPTSQSNTQEQYMTPGYYPPTNGMPVYPPSQAQPGFPNQPFY